MKLLPHYVTNQAQPSTVDSDNTLPNNFIISYRINTKTVLSKYTDSEWDLTPYSRKSTVFNFYNWHDGDDQLSSEIRDEIKRLTLFYLYGHSDKKPITVKKSYFKGFEILAGLAFNTGVSLYHAHKSDQFQLALKASIISANEGLLKIGTNNLRYLREILCTLSAIRHRGEHKGLKLPIIVPADQVEDALRMINKVLNNTEVETERTPLIPSRILAEVITGCENHISESAPYLDGAIAFAKALFDPSTSPAYALGRVKNLHGAFKSRRKQKKDRVTSAPEWSWTTEKNNIVFFDDAVKEHGCYELFSEKMKSKNFSLKALREHVSNLRTAGEILIHAYTGMRTHEMLVLPYNCFSEIEITGLAPLPLIRSHTSKIDANNYSAETVWATATSIKPVIQAMKKCTQILYYLTTAKNGEHFNPDGYPMFASAMPGATKENAHYTVGLEKISQWQAGKDSTKKTDPLYFLTNINITQADFAELNTFDAFREWGKDERFQVGKKWSLSSHQFRRSVAVYASRTGMVGLPSLSTQYKHLSKTMILCYTENSALAANIFQNENSTFFESHGVAKDFVDQRKFNMSVRFHSNVIESSERLSGGSGTKIQRHKDKDSLPIIFSDRSETKKAIDRGQLSYKDTILGGCTAKKCDKYGLYDVLPCDGCESSLIKPSNRITIADSLEAGLADLDPNSPYYNAVLQDIKKQRAKAQQENL